MNKREYLRSIGFTVGERGRFNDAMKTALAKYDGVFDEDQPDLKQNKVKKVKAAKGIINLPNQKRVREPRVLAGYTKEGFKVGFDGCSACNQHMVYCTCPNGVLAPKIVSSSADPLVRTS